MAVAVFRFFLEAYCCPLYAGVAMLLMRGVIVRASNMAAIMLATRWPVNTIWRLAKILKATIRRDVAATMTQYRMLIAGFVD
jgi:hypothetical protein